MRISFLFLFLFSTFMMVRGANVVTNGVDNVTTPVSPDQDPSQQPRNMYYIHPSKGPSSVSVTPVLTHSNYHS